jgi:hypothetical protein
MLCYARYLCYAMLCYVCYAMYNNMMGYDCANASTLVFNSM